VEPEVEGTFLCDVGECCQKLRFERLPVQIQASRLLRRYSNRGGWGHRSHSKEWYDLACKLDGAIMEEIGAFEAKNKLGSLLDRVERGEEIVISRRGKVVARLVPAGRAAELSEARAAAESLRTLRHEIHGPPMTWEELKSYRDEGRR